MRKQMKKIALIIMDAIVFTVIYLACVFMVSGFKLYSISIWLGLSIAGVTSFKMITNIVLNSYNHLWVYRNKMDLLRLVSICIFCNLCVCIVNLIVKYTSGNVLIFSALLFSTAIELLYLVFSRIVISYYLELRQRDKHPIEIGVLKPTMIIGAGAAGTLIYSEIRHNIAFDLDVVGFIDDDPEKIGKYVCNKKVFGPISELNSFTKKYGITNLIIACPSAGRERIKEIVNIIDYKNIEVMTVPNLSEMLSKDFTPSLRKISIADLLGRKAIQLNETGIEAFIGGKTILVTGGGGSIGSELCRQLCHYKPNNLVIFDCYENSVYDLVAEINIFYQHNPGVYRPNIISLIGSIRDEERLDEVFHKYRPNIVFHAAAHKHVPLMEDSPKEAIKNNVIGTYNVAKYAMKYRVDKMVMISTDKAVNPTNIMGASKRFAEMVIEAFDGESSYTRFSMVRFGNVLGSNGSVIPLFEKQIAAGGPLTVTSEKINRYFMTISEACSLVIQSGEFASGGEKFILDMGEPVKIIDLARKMIKLSGLVEGQDIKIEITGLRPGEKLFEELLLDKTKVKKTENDKIFIEKIKKVFTLNQIDDMISNLRQIWDESNAVLEFLRKTETQRINGIKENELETAVKMLA